MTLAGLKKCMPSTSPGRFVNAAIRSTSSVEVLVARIAPRFITASSARNTDFLTARSSNTASMIRSAFGRGGIVERRRDERGALRRVVGLQLALGHRAFVVLADAGDAAIERFLLRLEQRHGNAGVREIHGDAAAHGAGADDRDRGNLALRRLVGEARDLGRRALGEERMTQRLRFLADHELAEDLRSVAMPASNFCATRGADGLERARRRGQAARHGGHAGLRELQKGFGLRMFARQIAHAPDRLGVLA